MTKFVIIQALAAAWALDQTRQQRNQTKRERQTRARLTSGNRSEERARARAGAGAELQAAAEWQEREALLHSHSGQLGKRLHEQARLENWAERRKASAETRAKQAAREARARPEREWLERLHDAAVPWLNQDKSGYQVKAKVRKVGTRIAKHRAREQDSGAQVLARACPDLRTLALGLRILDLPTGHGQGQSYVTWWTVVTSPEARVERLLSDCGQAAARRAAGKFGRVSSTSIQEAAAAGRAAVVRLLRRPGAKRKDEFSARVAAAALESPAWVRMAGDAWRLEPVSSLSWVI